VSAAIARARWASVAGIALGCAHGYVGPDPAAGPTASIEIANPETDSRYSLMSENGAVINVYEQAPDCAKTYLGTVSVIPQKQEIRVRADRPAVLEFSLLVPARRASYSCKVEVGLVPAAGATYRVIASDNLRKRCSMRVLDANGQEAPGFDPAECKSR
jgi:hypothetical protein